MPHFSRRILQMHEIFIDDIHGINGFTPEDTMRHMGEIASPGMIGNGEDDRRYFTGKRGIETIYRVIFE